MVDAKVTPVLILFIVLAFAACGGDGETPEANGASHPLLGERSEGNVREYEEVFRSVLTAPAPETKLTIDYPLDESVFPPEFVPPTFLWHDDAPGADTWLVHAQTSTGEISMLVPGGPRPEPVHDPEAFSSTNEPYEGTEYQQSARAWTPSEAFWERMKAFAAKETATVTFHGFAADAPGTVLSTGSIRIRTAKDPVGAPIFYRDVPLRPAEGEAGRIQPLDPAATNLIAWRLRDVSRPEAHVVLKGMPTCGNCHSFSADGKTLGMDVDGPDGDKGMYALKDLEAETVIGMEDVITWNSFPGRPADHRTIGFLSRVSPDGNHVVSTVNESLFVANYLDFRFLQVFYPTRGILAHYSRKDQRMQALPGADDPEFVHCAVAWTPDGKSLVFCRAPACDPEPVDGRMPSYPNDPAELPMKFDLYRMPFDGGKGGTPVPIEGASNNGMSNTFPKVSPDGKWIVFVKCRNGQLLRPDGRLWIVPTEGGEAREMRCNTKTMNSWHSFSPNGRWMVFVSKQNTPYTQAFLTHIDEDGNDSPAILIPNCTADNRAVNLPEFLNAPTDSLKSITVPAVDHYRRVIEADRFIMEGRSEEAIAILEMAFETDSTFFRAHLNLGVCLSRLKRNREALDHFVRAYETDPSNLLARYNVGVTSLNLGRTRDATDAFRSLKKRAPDYPHIDTRIDEAEAQMVRLAAMIERCRMDLSKRVKDAPLEGTFAELLENAGRYRESLEHLERAVHFAPEDRALLQRLAWMLATSAEDSIRDPKRALSFAKRALKTEKRPEVNTLDILAAALAAAGRFGDAVVVAENAHILAEKQSPGRAALIAGRLALYRVEKPWRQPAFR